MSTTESRQEVAPTDADVLAPNPREVQAKIPFAVKEPHLLPAARYYSREFYELEKEFLWPHVWQMAARDEEIPRPGDYVEYEITGRSILLVRQENGMVKAFHNACRHRATQLAKGSGRFQTELVCPFHGWRWALDGSSSYVLKDSTFDPSCVSADELHLRECLVETWGGHIWINMDLEAAPLMEALSPVASLLEGVGVENMRVKWWKRTILNANWKMAQEAFFEGYHLPQTHPQLAGGQGQVAFEASADSLEYSAFRNGHARFEVRGGYGRPDPDAFLRSARLIADGQDAMILDREVRLFEGLRHRSSANDDFAAAAVEALYQYAEGAGIPLAPLTEKMSLWSGEIFLFPNYLMLPQFGNCLCYRSRPYQDDPERCEFEVWSLTTYPTGQEPERATSLGTFDKSDAEHWGLIPRQDFKNIERQQQGLHTLGFEHLRLSKKFEISLSNMHQELDRRIAARL
jgi:nitrite reductase/ring-hydroxylating ferredoxin subunit